MLAVPCPRRADVDRATDGGRGWTTIFAGFAGAAGPCPRRGAAQALVQAARDSAGPEAEGMRWGEVGFQLGRWGLRWRRGGSLRLCRRAGGATVAWADGQPLPFWPAVKQVRALFCAGIGMDGQIVLTLPLPAGMPPLPIPSARGGGLLPAAPAPSRWSSTARKAASPSPDPPEGRQFNGHGAFSADGARLYTSGWWLRPARAAGCLGRRRRLSARRRMADERPWPA